MGSSTLLIIAAVIGGVTVALQAQMMGLLDKSIGTLEGVFITYAGGGLLITITMIFMRGGNLGAWQSVPWYAYSSGALGLIIVGAIGYSAPRLGLVATFTIIGLRGGLYQTRHVLPALPSVAILAGSGFEQTRGKSEVFIVVTR